MHALAAQATRLALLPFHFVLLAGWRPLLAALVASLAGRLLTIAPALSVALGLLAGWVALGLPRLAQWPQPPEARLAGLGLLLLAETALRARGRDRWWLLPVSAALAAWWIEGAPLSGPGVLNAMPAFLGLAAALPLSRRLAARGQGPVLLAASFSLAGAMAVTGAPLPLVKAALVVAAALLPLLMKVEIAPVIASGLTYVATLTITAKARGELTPLDIACLAPLAVLAVTPALGRALSRSGPAAAALLAATACILLAWAASHTMPVLR